MRTLTPGQKLVKEISRQVCLTAEGEIVHQYSRHAVAWATETKRWVGDSYPTTSINDVKVFEAYNNMTVSYLMKVAN